MYNDLQDENVPENENFPTRNISNLVAKRML